MTYQVNFEQRQDYLVAIVTGENSAATVLGFLDDIMAECKKQDCFRVVIDKRTEGARLGVNDVFELVSQGAVKALGFFEAVAVVDPQTGEMIKYAEKLAMNRGVPIKMHDTVAEAELWMRGLGAVSSD